MKSIGSTPFRCFQANLPLLVILSMLVGCTPKMAININAIVDPDAATTNKQYILVSDNQYINENDLYFKEFARYFEQILKDQGYQKAPDSKHADMEIRFKYAVSDGRSGIQTYSFPVYAYIGGESITVITNTTGSGGTTTQTKTIRVPGHTRYVGDRLEARQYTLYNRTVNLSAVSLALANKDQGEKVIWQMALYNVSESDDLRQAMPFFAVAAKPFIGKNTSQQQVVSLDESDTQVQMLKLLTAP